MYQKNSKFILSTSIWPDSIATRLQQLFTIASSSVLTNITIESFDDLDDLEVCFSKWLSLFDLYQTSSEHCLWNIKFHESGWPFHHVAFTCCNVMSYKSVKGYQHKSSNGSCRLKVVGSGHISLTLWLFLFSQNRYFFFLVVF